MKKILTILLLFCGILSAYAINFSFSDEGFGMDADIVRVGDNIRMRYKINGFDMAAKAANASVDNVEGFSQIGNIGFDILVSCSEFKVKVLSMEIYGNNGNLIEKISNDNWVKIEKPEDIEKFKQICSRM